MTYLSHLNLLRIHSVREGAFRGLSRLVQLDLTHNNIDILYQMSAKSLAWFGPSLVSLSLEENQLEEFPDLSSLTGLQHLTLGNNPLMCACKLLPFYRWLSNASLKVEAVCGYPSELRGQSVIKADVFVNCSGENNQSFNETSIRINEDKLNKPLHSPAKARPKKLILNQQRPR
ncbi:hypothetical protein E1301_Tti001238 [Triplophysa tibetana]|uniref:LRRCT domain-containing protein n=1 Tax=Triplophysa tibetana TaxID=1572043 RepID=A0A5A9P892_9TELE|nr:hypothetical protein E1301_Tti001238 [Triplophysa tibetana]